MTTALPLCSLPLPVTDDDAGFGDKPTRLGRIVLELLA